jgi:hypothetical protein
MRGHLIGASEMKFRAMRDRGSLPAVRGSVVGPFAIAARRDESSVAKPLRQNEKQFAGRAAVRGIKRPSLARHAVVALMVFCLASLACVYANPYAIHQIIFVSYRAFDSPPADAAVVQVGRQRIDFRLPVPTLSAATASDLRTRFLRTGQPADCDIAGIVAYVRSRMNSADSTLPKASTTNAETLLRTGSHLYCLCGEHALVLNEALQACGLRSRVLWLEGHVVTECFDEIARKWVFLDAHLNVVPRDADGLALSAAELIWNLERDRPVSFAPIVSVGSQPNSSQYDVNRRSMRLWYRNVLLNGECRALAGSTLQYPSRWTHLFRFGRTPQMLVLETEFDTSHAQYFEPFQPHKCAAITAVLLGAFYLASIVLKVPSNMPAGRPCVPAWPSTAAQASAGNSKPVFHFTEYSAIVIPDCPLRCGVNAAMQGIDGSGGWMTCDAMSGSDEPSSFCQVAPLESSLG